MATSKPRRTTAERKAAFAASPEKAKKAEARKTKKAADPKKFRKAPTRTAAERKAALASSPEKAKKAAARRATKASKGYARTNTRAARASAKAKKK